MDPTWHLMRRSPIIVALSVAIVSGILTWWAFATEHTDAFAAFFVPGVVGFMLGGGVHSGFPEWWMLTWSAVFAGLTWGTVAYLAMRLISFVRRFSDRKPAQLSDEG